MPVNVYGQRSWTISSWEKEVSYALGSSLSPRPGLAHVCIWITLYACSRCGAVGALSMELTPHRVRAVFTVHPPQVLPEGAMNLVLLPLVRGASCILPAPLGRSPLWGVQCPPLCPLSCSSNHCFQSGNKAFQMQTLKWAYKLVY